MRWGAYLAGLDVARRFGAFGSYGPRLLPYAATALLILGRREEAGQLLAEVFELDLVSPADRFRPLIARGNLRMWDGDLAAAQADFRQVLAESPELDSARAAEVLSYVAEVALWDGRLPDGRTAVADGLAVLAAEQPYWTIQLCRTGLAIEAAAAVLALLAEGRTDRQIAEALFISPRTVAMHVSSILAKLGVPNRDGAAAVAHQHRLSG
jgi:DNA-binding CsgD family transcriptional regulator